MVQLILILASALTLAAASVSVNNPFYCYSQDPIRPQLNMFSIISTYETNRGHDSVDPSVSACTPSKFWLISRHGTRLPSRTDITNILAHNERLHQDILTNYDEGRTSLCASDIALIRNWRFDPNITADMEQLLTVAGWNEFLELAHRYQAAFQTLLPSTYSTSHYSFRTTHTQRALGSMRAFADGLFGFNGFEHVEFENVPEEDLLLRPHDFCPLFDSVTVPSTEQQAFMRMPEFQEMLSQVSAKLGFHGPEQLRFSEIEVLVNLCKFEQIWNINATSPMCAAFSIANHQVLEYYEDLHFYYRFGYGHAETFRTLLEGINCDLMQDMLTFMQSTDPNAPTARLFGGHTATMQLILVTLGLFEDEVPLTRHNFAQQTFRKWKSSLLAPKGTNLVVVRYE